MLGYRDVMKISEFQEVEADNRATETNRYDEPSTFHDESED